jgi:hypothetical protein
MHLINGKRSGRARMNANDIYGKTRSINIPKVP